MNSILKYDESNTKQNKRSEIIDLSMKLFILEGIHPVTMADLAKECNISLRSLYYYYSNKQDLAVDIQIICMHKFTEVQNIDLAKSKTAYMLLEDLFSSMLSFIAENANILKYITAFDYHFHNEYPSDKYNKSLLTIKAGDFFNSFLERADDGSIELHGSEMDVFITTLLQSFFAYSQKIIYREKAMLSEEINARGDLKLFTKMLLNSVKKR